MSNMSHLQSFLNKFAILGLVSPKPSTNLLIGKPPSQTTVKLNLFRSIFLALIEYTNFITSVCLLLKLTHKISLLFKPTKSDGIISSFEPQLTIARILDINAGRRAGIIIGFLLILIQISFDPIWRSCFKNLFFGFFIVAKIGLPLPSTRLSLYSFPNHDNETESARVTEINSLLNISSIVNGLSSGRTIKLV